MYKNKEYPAKLIASDKKLDAMKCYESQVVDFPGPRSIQAVEALAKFRGTQAGFGFGEGMHIIRMVC